MPGNAGSLLKPEKARKQILPWSLQKGPGSVNPFQNKCMVIYDSGLGNDYSIFFLCLSPMTCFHMVKNSFPRVPRLICWCHYTWILVPLPNSRKKCDEVSLCQEPALGPPTRIGYRRYSTSKAKRSPSLGMGWMAPRVVGRQNSRKVSTHCSCLHFSIS